MKKLNYYISKVNIRNNELVANNFVKSYKIGITQNIFRIKS